MFTSDLPNPRRLPRTPPPALKLGLIAAALILLAWGWSTLFSHRLEYHSREIAVIPADDETLTPQTNAFYFHSVSASLSHGTVALCYQRCLNQYPSGTSRSTHTSGFNSLTIASVGVGSIDSLCPPADARVLKTPLFVLLVLATVPGAFLWGRDRRRCLVLRARNQCYHCGYERPSLTPADEASHRCTECGMSDASASGRFNPFRRTAR